MIYKSYLIPTKKIKCIREYVPKNYKRFVDPAIHNGSIFVNLSPEKWLINNENNTIYNMWSVLKDNPIELSRCLSSNYFDEISKPTHAAMFMYLQDYKDIISNPELYLNNIKNISRFMNKSDGNIFDMRADDILNNFVEADDFVFLEFKNINRSNVKIHMMDAINSLDDKNVKWMILHNNNAYVRKQFENYNTNIADFNADELIITNY